MCGVWLPFPWKKSEEQKKRDRETKQKREKWQQELHEREQKGYREAALSQAEKRGRQRAASGGGSGVSGFLGNLESSMNSVERNLGFGGFDPFGPASKRPAGKSGNRTVTVRIVAPGQRQTRRKRQRRGSSLEDVLAI